MPLNDKVKELGSNIVRMSLRSATITWHQSLVTREGITVMADAISFWILGIISLLH